MLLSGWFRALLRPSTFHVQQQDKGSWWSAVEYLFPGQSRITENKHGKKHIYPWLGSLKPPCLRQVHFAVPVSWMKIFTSVFKWLWITAWHWEGPHGWHKLLPDMKKLSEAKNLAICSCASLSLYSPKGLNPWTTFLPTQKAFTTTENYIQACWFWACAAASSSQAQVNVCLGEYLLKIGTTDIGQLFLQVPWDVWLNEKCCNKANSVHKSANNSRTWSHCSHK